MVCSDSELQYPRRRVSGLAQDIQTRSTNAVPTSCDFAQPDEVTKHQKSAAEDLLDETERGCFNMFGIYEAYWVPGCIARHSSLKA